jgi:hypothetical protein
MGASSIMAHGNERNEGCRTERVKFLGTVLALIQLKNGEQVRAKLHELSANGGVLHIAEPLDEALSIELLFKVGSTTVRNQAELLGPIWATKGCLQPFRFTGLSDEVRNKLQNDLAGFLPSRHN